MSTDAFILHSEHIPQGDQPEAIARLISNIQSGVTHQTLRGITGSGKTFTMANVIHRLKRPTIILAPNKTLTAQLYEEMKHYFPENAVEYFVSYYDYFQPEIYMPGSDRFIQKDSSINEQLERLRLSTTKSLIERRDTIVVASVSSVYGLGDPDEYRRLQLSLEVGMKLDISEIEVRLDQLQYDRTERKLKRATYRIKDNIIDIYPADSEFKALRLVCSSGNEVTEMFWIDAVTEKKLDSVSSYLVSPKTLFSSSRKQIDVAVEGIKKDMEKFVSELNEQGRVQEAERLYERVTNDIERLKAEGYCSGIENYSSYLSGRDPSLPPFTLLDYLPKDGILFIDESHVMIPQISAMYKADQSRKSTLIEYGFRLPSSQNNHPLSFEEFEKIKPQAIFVSATPGKYEIEKSKDKVVDQFIRPTGLLDPEIEVRPSEGLFDDLLKEVENRIEVNERVLVTTLTKVDAEELYEKFTNKGIKARYIHSDIKTDERVEIINGLRAGDFDVLIGISLLREGLDIPEASLISILGADRAGFLRSTRSLIQMIGRVARNKNGKAILYADTITPAMQEAIDETSRRRKLQIKFNEENNINPSTSLRSSSSAKEEKHVEIIHSEDFCSSLSQLCHQITATENLLFSANESSNEKEAEKLRLKLDKLYRQFIYVDQN